jgi:hypothetical protein
MHECVAAAISESEAFGSVELSGWVTLQSPGPELEAVCSRQLYCRAAACRRRDYSLKGGEREREVSTLCVGIIPAQKTSKKVP